MVGSSHRGVLGRVLPGSVGESLLRGAPCAVAIAPRGYAREHHEIGLIGVAYDGSEEAKLALAEAKRLARAHGADMRVITVVPVLAALAPRADLAARVATALRREYRRFSQEAIAAVGDETSAESVLIEGDPGAVLAEQGDGLDLLVVGSRGYGPIRSALLGAVSAEVIRRAPCPVLVATRGSSPLS